MQRITEAAGDHRRLLERFIKWSVVGTIGAVVDYGIYIGLTRFIGLEEVIAQSISFTCAVINNYILNRIWTFGDIKHKRPEVQFLQFFIVSVMGLATRTAIFFVLFRLFNIPDLLAMAIAIIIVLIWNFFANRAWTFREVD